MPHCAVCVEHTRFEPRLEQPYQGALLHALRQHPEEPLMVDVVERAYMFIPLSITHILSQRAT